MKDTAKTTLRKLLVIPPLALGVAMLVILVGGRQAPERLPPSEHARKVRVITVPSVTVVPRALGYGIVQPATVWEAVAEVSGRILEINPLLRKGSILPRGAVLLRLDPADYQLAAAQIEAYMGGVRAQLAEIGIKGENTRASLAIEERGLQLSLNDIERKRQLLERKAVSQAAVDQEERNVLGHRQSVQALENILNLIPAERQILESQLAVLRAQMEDVQLDLQRTIVTAPFDGRIAEVNVERTQFVRLGTVMAVIDGIDVAEVTAQLSVDKILGVVSADDRPDFSAASIAEELPDLLGLDPVVRLRAGDRVLEWAARLARISDTVDPQTRTIGVIVAVDDPYTQGRPGVRPPLTKNMFVEVELRGRPRDGQVVVPRSALHDDRVFIVGPDNRLEIRAVDVTFEQANFAVIGNRLQAGERVVVSDLVPAISGALLDPEEDTAAADTLVAEARGAGAVR